MTYHQQKGVIMVTWLFYNFAVNRDAARRAGLSATAELRQINQIKSNLFATKQMNNFYSKARNISTGHKGSFQLHLQVP